MISISQEEFINSFIKISFNLTSAELRMLYLIINDPSILGCTQEQFAQRIGVNRRTIIIGIKKLKKHKYLKNIPNNEYLHQTSAYFRKLFAPKSDKWELKHAKKIVIEKLNQFYNPFIETQSIINADFYSLIIGDYSLAKDYRFNKEFITQTIVEYYPNSKFFFKAKKAFYKTNMQYLVCQQINSEINISRQKGRYYIVKDVFLDRLYESLNINEDDVTRIINECFSNLEVEKNKILIPRPWKGKRMS